MVAIGVSDMVMEWVLDMVMAVGAWVMVTVVMAMAVTVMVMVAVVTAAADVDAVVGGKQRYYHRYLQNMQESMRT